MDINVVRIKKACLQTELANYLSDPVKYQKEITVTRGRLLRILHKEFKLETNAVIKGSILNEIKTQSGLHNDQLNNRVRNNRRVDTSFFKQISMELGLKFKKLTNNIQNLKYSNSVKKQVSNGFEVAGNAISMAGTVLKAPVVGALRLGKNVAPIVGKIVVCPLHVPVFLFSKIINPDSKYTGKTIKNMGNFLGQEVGKILVLAEQGVRKL